ncbi:hypothetical protein K1719_030218 [Acacia pycnantha]|nr:hypothetical protein K1719_030218 [Acacia pycnantha]
MEESSAVEQIVNDSAGAEKEESSTDGGKIDDSDGAKKEESSAAARKWRSKEISFETTTPHLPSYRPQCSGNLIRLSILGPSVSITPQA